MAFDRETKTAIKQFMKVLPGELQARHGGSGHGGYSAGQVEAAVRRTSLQIEFLPYALMLFCYESEVQRALAEKPDVLEKVVSHFRQAANAGFIDVTGWSVGSWLTSNVVNTLSGEGVGEIGSEGGDC